MKNSLLDKTAVEKLALQILAVDELPVGYTSAVPLEQGTGRDATADAGQTDVKVEILIHISCIRLIHSIQFLRVNDASRIRLSVFYFLFKFYKIDKK